MSGHGLPRSIPDVYARLEALEAGSGGTTVTSVNGETGDVTLAAADVGALAAVPAPTTTVVGGVKLGATIAAPAALTATADTASTAEDVAALLTDHNDLVTKYNALLVDVTAIRNGYAAVLAQLKAQTIPASA